jgi:hypothetical protein
MTERTRAYATPTGQLERCGADETELVEREVDAGLPVDDRHKEPHVTVAIAPSDTNTRPIRKITGTNHTLDRVLSSSRVLIIVRFT